MAHIPGDKHEKAWLQITASSLMKTLRWHEWGRMPDVNSDGDFTDEIFSQYCRFRCPEEALSEMFDDMSFATFIGDSSVSKAA